jgi:hypothetical protein
MACFAGVSFQDGKGSVCAEAPNDQANAIVNPTTVLENK